MNRRTHVLWVFVLLTACASQAGPRLETVDDVLGALEDAGAVIAETAILAHPGLGAPGQVWQVNRSLVQITEFESEAARQAVSDRLSPDGLTLDGQPLVWSDRPHLWAIGRVIVAYEGMDGPTILLLSGLLGDPLTTQPGADAPYPPAVTAAISALADDLAIDPAMVEVVSFEEAEWPDACLGAAGPGEACAEVVTPGWRVILQASGETYELHTDLIGSDVRGF
jgi:hypothetical protein